MGSGHSDFSLFLTAWAEFLTWRVITATVNTGSIILSGRTWGTASPAALLHRAQGWRAARPYHTLTLGFNYAFRVEVWGEKIETGWIMGKKCKALCIPAEHSGGDLGSGRFMVGPGGMS